jgi:hypothetical protein
VQNRTWFPPERSKFPSIAPGVANIIEADQNHVLAATPAGQLSRDAIGQEVIQRPCR